jgi:hypothetical protein
MPLDQNAASDYMAEVAVAENRKQEAIRQAQARFDAERAAILAKWTDAVQSAQLAWDAVKSDPEHPQEPDARAAIDALRSTPPDYREARDHLADGMRKADADYQSALAAARAKHGVVVVPPVR